MKLQLAETVLESRLNHLSCRPLAPRLRTIPLAEKSLAGQLAVTPWEAEFIETGFPVTAGAPPRRGREVTENETLKAIEQSSRFRGRPIIVKTATRQPSGPNFFRLRHAYAAFPARQVLEFVLCFKPEDKDD